MILSIAEERPEVDPPPQDYTLGQYVAMFVGGLLGVGAAIWLIGAGLRRLWPGGWRGFGGQQGVVAVQPVLAVPAQPVSSVSGPPAAEENRSQAPRVRRSRRRLFPAARESQGQPSTEVEVLTSSSSEEDTG